MEPATHNLTLFRDRDFSQVFTFKDGDGVIIDLTGYSAAAQIRAAKDDDTLIVAFTIVVSEAEGEVTISLTDVQTLAIEQSKAWWDLVLTDTLGLRQSYVEGGVAIKGTVTRAA